jgi:uncharacterized protein (DUF488 family)
MTTRTLYTIGYEGIDVDVFIKRLRDSGVRTVVDVRELPLSRKPGFSKKALSQHLASAGIAYFHSPMLGCPKAIRNRYRVDNNWQRYTRDFTRHLTNQAESVDELAKIARATTTCLVCYEADYAICHRTYVARAARRVGAPRVMHLTDRTACPDEPIRLAA